MGPLLDSVRRFASSELLDRTTFRFAEQSDDQLIAEMIHGSERLSWLNRFTKAEFHTEAALLVDRMFGAHIPNGWTQWGFKEIRYGLNNDAPEILLSLFPSATAVFTFRDPARTLKSMRTWGRPGLLDNIQHRDFDNVYRNCAQVWATVVRYFLDFRRTNVPKIYFISEDQLNLPTNELLGTIGIPMARDVPKKLNQTNPGPASWPLWANKQFEALFSKEENSFKDLYAECCGMSNQDFNGISY